MFPDARFHWFESKSEFMQNDWVNNKNKYYIYLYHHCLIIVIVVKSNPTARYPQVLETNKKIEMKNMTASDLRQAYVT